MMILSNFEQKSMPVRTMACAYQAAVAPSPRSRAVRERKVIEDEESEHEWAKGLLQTDITIHYNTLEWEHSIGYSIDAC